MPAPPKESIGGTHSHQIAEFEFCKTSYNYLLERELFTKTEEFYALDQAKRDSMTSEIKNQTKAYELLWARVETY